VSFSELASTGLFQVNIKVPALPPGDYPVSLTVGSVSNLVAAVIPVR
jgi:uncharacterized protein (TIGR03437 family)